MSGKIEEFSNKDQRLEKRRSVDGLLPVSSKKDTMSLFVIRFSSLYLGSNGSDEHTHRVTLDFGVSGLPDPLDLPSE